MPAQTHSRVRNGFHILANSRDHVIKRFVVVLQYSPAALNLEGVEEGYALLLPIEAEKEH